MTGKGARKVEEKEWNISQIQTGKSLSVFPGQCSRTRPFKKGRRRGWFKYIIKRFYVNI
jgi:hypothetical protein